MDSIDNLSKIIQQTEEYKQICTQCKDEILIYPTISGRTNYTQEEVEAETLRVILMRYKEAKINWSKLTKALNQISFILELHKENLTAGMCEQVYDDISNIINDIKHKLKRGNINDR